MGHNTIFLARPAVRTSTFLISALTFRSTSFFLGKFVQCNREKKSLLLRIQSSDFLLGLLSGFLSFQFLPFSFIQLHIFCFVILFRPKTTLVANSEIDFNIWPQELRFLTWPPKADKWLLNFPTETKKWQCIVLHCIVLKIARNYAVILTTGTRIIHVSCMLRRF